MHDHAHRSGDDRPLFWSILVNVLLTVAQIVGGLVSGSLSLVADALHNLNDAAALGIALLARRIARRPADRRRTFGYRRAEVIGALINLTTLLVVGVFLGFQAIGRIFAPEPIAGWIVVIVAGIALIVDVVTALLTYALSKGDMNVRAAFIHNVSDALASVAVILSGTLILLYEWYWTDVVATLLISGYVLWHGLAMIRATIRILMEGVPDDLTLEEVTSVLHELEGVQDVHHVHVWQLDERHRALEAHLVLDAAGRADPAGVKGRARAAMREDFRIDHCTLELEHPDETADCAPGDPAIDCHGSH